MSYVYLLKALDSLWYFHGIRDALISLLSALYSGAKSSTRRGSSILRLFSVLCYRRIRQGRSSKKIVDGPACCVSFANIQIFGLEPVLCVVTKLTASIGLPILTVVLVILLAVELKSKVRYDELVELWIRWIKVCGIIGTCTCAGQKLGSVDSMFSKSLRRVLGYRW